MKNPITLITDLIFTGATVMGIRKSQEPNYRLLSDFGAIQIRLYQPMLIAETVIKADYTQSGSIGFNRLAGYIFGRNAQQQKMEMTTPVLREPVGENMAMTMPVFQESSDKQWLMSFVMPFSYDLQTLPQPLDPSISIKAIAEKKVATLRYSGSLNLGSITEQSGILLAWLDEQRIKPLSSPRSAAYDPPWTIPALRRNEIHIDID